MWNDVNKRGLLVVVSSPSGAGKTTLCQKLLKEFDNLRFSVSVTTRKPRANEQDGVDYHFVDAAMFDRMVENDEFAEWAEVHGNRYGTPRRVLTDAMDEGKDVLFDIDWQGGRQIQARFPGDCVLIWILPPSLSVLEERLRRRATDAPEIIERRLVAAKHELEQYGIYDYVLINDDLEKAYNVFRSIYVAAHYTRERAAPKAEKFVQEMRRG